MYAVDNLIIHAYLAALGIMLDTESSVIESHCHYGEGRLSLVFVCKLLK